jgi:hypothetical protein
MQRIGIQKIFWDSFELVLSTQAKRLVKDIADSLGEDAAPLLKSIQSEQVGVYLFEETEDTDTSYMEMRCSHCTPIPTMPHFVTQCMEPVVWSANPSGRVATCLQHALNPCPKQESWLTLSRVVDDDTTYYVDVRNERVYDLNGELCGTYKNGRIRVFCMAAA